MFPILALLRWKTCSLNVGSGFDIGGYCGGSLPVFFMMS